MAAPTTPSSMRTRAEGLPARLVNTSRSMDRLVGRGGGAGAPATGVDVPSVPVMDGNGSEEPSGNGKATSGVDGGDTTCSGGLGVVDDDGSATSGVKGFLLL